LYVKKFDGFCLKFDEIFFSLIVKEKKTLELIKKQKKVAAEGMLH